MILHPSFTYIMCFSRVGSTLFPRSYNIPLDDSYDNHGFSSDIIGVTPILSFIINIFALPGVTHLGHLPVFGRYTVLRLCKNYCFPILFQCSRGVAWDFIFSLPTPFRTQNPSVFTESWLTISLILICSVNLTFLCFFKSYFSFIY